MSDMSSGRIFNLIFQQHNYDQEEDVNEDQIYEDTLQLNWDDSNLNLQKFVKESDYGLLGECFQDKSELLRLERQIEISAIDDVVGILVEQMQMVWTKEVICNLMQACWRQNVDPLYGLENEKTRSDFINNVLRCHAMKMDELKQKERDKAAKAAKKAGKNAPKQKAAKKNPKVKRVVDDRAGPERIELDLDPDTGEAIRVKGYNKDGTKRAKALRLSDALKDTDNKKDWSTARFTVWSSLGIGVDGSEGYHYRFNHQGEATKNGPWSLEEHTVFMENMARRGTNRNWGTFSKNISGRVGYICSSYYRKLLEKGWIWDNFYVMEPKRMKTRLLLQKQSPMNEKEYNRRLRYSFIVLRDPSGVFGEVPAFHKDAEPEFVERLKDNPIIKERVEYFKDVSHDQLVSTKAKGVDWGYAKVLWKDRVWQQQDPDQDYGLHGPVKFKSQAKTKPEKRERPKRKRAPKRKKAGDDSGSPKKKRKRAPAAKPVRSRRRKKDDDEEDEEISFKCKVDFVVENPLPGFLDCVTGLEVEKPAWHAVDLNQPDGNGYVLDYSTWSMSGKNILGKGYNRRRLVKLTFDNIAEYKERITPLPDLTMTF